LSRATARIRSKLLKAVCQISSSHEEHRPPF
jgi:hypothetical protein